jgi:hypothetical protein
MAAILVDRAPHRRRDGNTLLAHALVAAAIRESYPLPLWCALNVR